MAREPGETETRPLTRRDDVPDDRATPSPSEPDEATVAAPEHARAPVPAPDASPGPALSLDAVLARLADSALVSSDDLRSAVQSLRHEPHASPELLVRELEARGQITGFQAQRLLGAPSLLRLGSYHLLERLGAGGMGIVYAALDRERGERVALKTLKEFDARTLYYFKREFRSRADLHHPNLVSLYEFACEDGQWFFTMELIQGVSFLDHVRPGFRREAPPARPSTFERDDPRPTDRGQTEETARDDSGSGEASPTAQLARPMPDPDTQALDATRPDANGGHAKGSSVGPLDEARLRASMRQLAEGVAALHAADKLHRDLKPSNVMVERGGRVVLLDFGLITDLVREFEPTGEGGGGSGESATTGIAGTLAYMAPEQADGDPLTEACDWYAVGVMLYEALAGRRPFGGGTLKIITGKQLGKPVPPREIDPAAPGDLEALCLELLRPRPEDRPTGTEVLRRLGVTSADDPPSTLSRRTPFVGRAEHLAALDESYRAVRRGSERVVLVHGRSGAGKSALVQRFLESLPIGDGAVVLAGRCFEQESVPYKALDSLVDALGRFLRRLPHEEAEALVPEDAAALSRVFPVLELADLPLRELSIRDPHELRRRAFGALRTILERIAERHPLVLVIDDLQWGDADSAALLVDLLRPPEPPRLLLLACYRSEYEATSPCLRPFLAALDVRDGSEAPSNLAVEAMTPDEGRRLALELLARTDPDGEALAERIAREAGGSPYFISELVQNIRSGADLGAITDSAGAVDLDAVLRGRIGRLPEEPRRLLEVIAVASRPLTLRDATTAAGLGGEVGRADSVLRAGRLIRGTGPRLDDEVEAFHDRIRETILAALPPDVARETNRDLALTLESSGNADPETLAVHFEAAGEPSQAGLYYARAADAAASALAFDRAASLYRRSLQLRPVEGEEARSLRTKLADALANAGRGPEAADEYLEAASGADRREGIELERRAAYQYCISGHLDRGQGVLRSVLGRVGMSLPASQTRGLISMLAHRLMLRIQGLEFRERPAEDVPGDDLARIDVSWSVAAGLGTKNIIVAPLFQTKNLRLALRAGEPLRVVRALALEAAYNANVGRSGWKRTQTLYDLAVRHAQGRDDPYIEGMLTLCGAILAFHQAHWKRGAEMADRAGTIFRESCTGAAWELGQANTFMLWCMSWMGEYAAMAERSRRILAEALEKGDLFTVANLGGYVDPLALVGRGEPDEAERSVRSHVQPWTRDYFHLQHLTALMSLTYIHLYRGEARAAYDAHLAAWPAMKRNLIFHSQMTRVAMFELRARSALAVAASSGGNAKSALRDTDRLARTLERERVPLASAMALHIRAGLTALRGDRSASRRLLGEAVDAYSALDMGLYAAACRRQLGRSQAADGEPMAEAAREWMLAHGIADPDRMAATFLPWPAG